MQKVCLEGKVGGINSPFLAAPNHRGEFRTGGFLLNANEWWLRTTCKRWLHKHWHDHPLYTVINSYLAMSCHSSLHLNCFWALVLWLQPISCCSLHISLDSWCPEGTRGAVSSKIPAIGVPWLPTPLEHRHRHDKADKDIYIYKDAFWELVDS